MQRTHSHFDKQLPQTLFLGDLPLLCTEDLLFQLFSPYGRIESIQLKKEEPRDKMLRKIRKSHSVQQQQRQHLSYGFVKYLNHDSAAMAVQSLNDSFILGRRIRVCWARDNPGLEYLPAEAIEATMQTSNGKKTAQIHVLYITPILHATISELDLYEAFRAFGKVVDVSIKKSVINEERRIQSGYGFIHFELSEEGIRSALRAIEVMNHRIVNNITYEVTITHGLRNQLSLVRPQAQNLDLKWLVSNDTQHAFDTQQSWESSISRSASNSTAGSYDLFLQSPRWSDASFSSLRSPSYSRVNNSHSLEVSQLFDTQDHQNRSYF